MACLTCSHVLKVDTSINSVPHRLADLEKKLQAFWDLDTLGIVDGENSVYDKFVESVSFQDGRYCVSLPWKTPRPMLPDNFELSQRRLFNLLKRLRQTPHVLTQYDAVIREQIKSGIVEIVENPHDGPIGATHYIPHHAVIREDKKTTKMRIVYDASAKSTGPSLNCCLYAGPTFGQNILDILIRFRVFRIAVTADIEKAFLMVSVAREDRDALRFLWVDDVTAPLPRLVTLRFARVVFGVSSSPFLLNATIRRHVEGYRLSDPLFVERFIRSIYVDDLTCGSDSEEGAIELYTKSRQCMAEAGFNLRKFISNSSAVQAHISSQTSSTTEIGDGLLTHDDESYTKTTLGEHEQSDNSGTAKVLGVKWRPRDVVLIFDISNLHSIATVTEPTKRNIIGLCARFYDPLGFVSPVTVRFKVLFQEICAAKLDWDAHLDGELLKKWNGLLLGLRQSQPLYVPRCYFHGLDKPTSCNLVGFCDASKTAYAAVVYLKMRLADKCVVRFVVSRTRVAPLNTQWIPRLELLAALLLSRLLSSVASALGPELVLGEPVCYTDSKNCTVLDQGI